MSFDMRWWQLLGAGAWPSAEHVDNTATICCNAVTPRASGQQARLVHGQARLLLLLLLLLLSGTHDGLAASAKRNALAYSLVCIPFAV
jgi:hypothetical protein